MDLLQILIDCYNNNNFNDIESILAPDCSYASQWVFEEMVGGKRIAEYLIAKTDTIERYKAYVLAKRAKILYPYRGQDCALLYQDDLENPDCLVLIKTKENKISHIDICEPGLFRYELA